MHLVVFQLNKEKAYGLDGLSLALYKNVGMR